MLAFPVGTAALALAVAAVLWASDRWQKWSEERIVESPVPVLPRVTASKASTVKTLAQLNGRHGLAQLVMTSGKARIVALGANTGIILVSGRSPFTRGEDLIFASALANAVQVLGEEFSERTQDRQAGGVPVEDSPEPAALPETD